MASLAWVASGVAMLYGRAPYVDRRGAGSTPLLTHL